MEASLDKRMKFYEQQEAKRLMPLLPACARLDGRGFHVFCRNLQRPYDSRLSAMMQDVTHWLVKETGAIIGYTQSDEITLIWYADNPKTQIFCDGRIHKMVSLLASLTTACFNRLLNLPDADGKYRIPEKQKHTAHFDCRVWNVPTLEEAANLLLWRELDATKNSISMAARTIYSHKQLMGKHSGEMQEMLFAKGINWNDYPAFFKRGTYFARRKFSSKFSPEEIEKLPLKHQARLNPNLVIERTKVVRLAIPPLSQIEDVVKVLFESE